MASTLSPEQHTQHLTIILLCSGNGSDSSKYRPARDDVRYRHRHDALVRCAAAALFGAAGAKDRQHNGLCEVIYFYDGDLSCMHMAVDAGSNSSFPQSYAPSQSTPSCSLSSMCSVPFEKNVVSAWRNASKDAVRKRQYEGMIQNHTRNESTHTGSLDSKPMSTSSSMGIIFHNNPSSNRDPGEYGIETQLKTSCVLNAWKEVQCSLSFMNNETNSSQRTKGGESFLNKTQPTLSKLPSDMPSSKREILTLLQNTCPVEFLRKHSLNVDLNLALRKFNRESLKKVWGDYIKHLANGFKGDCEGSGHGDQDGGKNICEPEGSQLYSLNKNNSDRIERTFRCILTKSGKNDVQSTGPFRNTQVGNDIVHSNLLNYSTDVIAAYLHESCNAELPCWGWDAEVDGDTSSSIEPVIGFNKQVRHIYLFLGAVRDMTNQEHEALVRACSNLKIPLVPCRLGPVPEFTSKIVSVAGYHYYRGVLGGGLVILWKKIIREWQQRHQVQQEKKEENEKEKGYGTKIGALLRSGACTQSSEERNNSPDIRKHSESGTFSTTPRALTQDRTLHTIVLVPIFSHSLTSDPALRDRTHWCMVRLCVNSLWRSKFVSASASTSSTSCLPLNNKLTFLFTDGVHITLEQNEFISTMAEKHKAAPSERQILEELCHRRDDPSAKCLSNDSTFAREKISDENGATALSSTRLQSICKEILSNNDRTLQNEGNSFALDFTGIHQESEQSPSVQCAGLIDAAYSKDYCDKTFHKNVTDASIFFVLLHVKNSPLAVQQTSRDTETHNTSTTVMKQIHTSFQKEFENRGIQLIRQSPLLEETTAQDREAFIVVILQHLDYQGRLFSLLRHIGVGKVAIFDDESRKTKKRKKKEKKQKRSSISEEKSKRKKQKRNKNTI